MWIMINTRQANSQYSCWLPKHWWGFFPQQLCATNLSVTYRNVCCSLIRWSNSSVLLWPKLEYIHIFSITTTYPITLWNLLEQQVHGEAHHMYVCVYSIYIHDSNTILTSLPSFENSKGMRCTKEFHSATKIPCVPIKWLHETAFQFMNYNFVRNKVWKFTRTNQ